MLTNQWPVYDATPVGVDTGTTVALKAHRTISNLADRMFAELAKNRGDRDFAAIVTCLTLIQCTCLTATRDIYGLPK